MSQSKNATIQGGVDLFLSKKFRRKLVYKLGLLPIAKAEEAPTGILFDIKLGYTIGHIMAQIAFSPCHAIMPKRPL